MRWWERHRVKEAQGTTVSPAWDNDLLIGGTGADSFRFSATNTLSNSGDDQ